MNTRLKELRKALGLTQTAFAKKLRKSNNYIYMLEAGSKPISDSFIFLLCATFNVSEEWLRTGTGDMFAPSTRESEIAEIAAEVFKKDGKNIDDPLLMDFIKLTSQLDSDQLKLILSIAENFSKKKDTN